MTYFHKYALCFTIFFVLFGCINQNSRKKEIIKDSSTEIVKCNRNYIEEDFKLIDFFGIKMQGTYEDIVDKIYALPVLSLVDRRDTIMLQGNGSKWFSHKVEFCGVPWGMSANFTLSEDNIMSIYDLKFITSKTDNYIIDHVVGKLTKYYGKPDISDEIENSYHWFEPDKLCIRVRHLQTMEGGWTVNFYIN